MSRMKRLLFGFALLAACQASGGSTSGKTAHRSKRDQQRYDGAVARGDVKLGMTKSELLRSRGQPRKKTRETYRGRKNVEVWLYAWSQIYFDHDGYVASVHSSAR